VADVDEQVGLRERKRVQTAERLQSAALELISERGFDAVSVDDICAAAEVSKTTYYRYFETKEDVLLGGATDDIEFLRRAFAECPPDESLIEAARYAYRRFAETEQADRATRLLVNRIAQTTPSVAARHLCHYQRWEDLLRAEAQRRSPEGTDPALVWVRAAVVAGAMRAASEYWLHRGAKRPLGELVDAALDDLRDHVWEHLGSTR
jgi:AcrR family transcriptional regulator